MAPLAPATLHPKLHLDHFSRFSRTQAHGGLVAEWLACWTQAQNGLGSNRSRNAVG